MGCQDNGCWQGRHDCPTPDDCLGLVRRIKPYPYVAPAPSEVPPPIQSDWREKLVDVSRCVLLIIFVGAITLALLSLGAFIT